MIIFAFILTMEQLKLGLMYGVILLEQTLLLLLLVILTDVKTLES